MHRTIVTLSLSMMFAISCAKASHPVTDARNDSNGDTSDAVGTSDAAVCSPATCSGCCQNGFCQPGRTKLHCGTGGNTCDVCTAPNTICKTERACGIDPDHVWTVQPTMATIAANNGGSGWDIGGGLPDPFVTLACPTGSATTIKTPTANNTLSPTWASGSCTMTTKDLEAIGFELATFDEDTAINDTISAKGPLKPTETNLSAGSMTISNGGNLVSLTIQFQP
jgi:hypothetical protein